MMMIAVTAAATTAIAAPAPRSHARRRGCTRLGTFHRPRTTVFVSVIPGQAFSFPSGHAMVSIAFYCGLAVIGWRLLRGRPRIAWLTAMTVLVFLVGVSRLFLDVHYPTDDLAGWAGGLFWLDVTLALVRAVAAQRASSTNNRLRPNPIGGPPCSNARRGAMHER